MDYSSVAVIFASAVSLIGLWLFFRWPYQSFRADQLREELFALRGELFDLAVDGVIDFDHPAYGGLRRTLNGLLRFGHHSTFLSVFGHMLFCRMEDMEAAGVTQASRRWRSALANTSEAARIKIALIEDRMHMAVLKHVTTSSILVLTLIPLLLLLAASVLTIRKRLAPWFRKIDSAALLIGDNELAPA